MNESDELEQYIGNLPLRKISHGGLTIDGYSRGAVQSYWRVQELKIGFDIGASPWSYMGLPSYLISHCHLDHLAGLPALVARRKMMKMAPPKLYVPAETVSPIEGMLRSWQRLDYCRMVYEIHGVEPGDEFELSREHVVTVLKTYHTVPSVGYIVWERRKKLKPEYVGLSGTEIRDLKFSGTEVTHEIRVPRIAYLGDSTAQVFDDHPELYEAQILISEMTFYRKDHRAAEIRKFGHMHLDDYIERADRFQNELILLGHMSTRYHLDQVRKAVNKRMPEQLRSRVELWMSH